MREELKETINDLIKLEKKLSNRYEEKFVDSNHALGVIYEEMLETKRALRKCDEEFKKYVNSVIDRDEISEMLALHDLRVSMFNLIEESIQVSAMCEKGIESNEFKRKA